MTEAEFSLYPEREKLSSVLPPPFISQESLSDQMAQGSFPGFCLGWNVSPHCEPIRASMKRHRDWKGQEVSTIHKKKMSDATVIENWPKDMYEQAFHQRAAVALET